MQNKKIIAVFIMLVFCAALAIGSSTVFTIAEVEASYSLVSSEQKDKINDIDTLLDKFEGENIVFLKNSQIYDALKSYTYLKVTEIKKIYPNSIIVNITERKELFAVLNEQKYYMLDIEGFVLSEKSINQNNIDNQSNIILEASGSYTVGEYALPQYSELFNCIMSIAKQADTYLKSINSSDYIRNSVIKVSVVNGININIVMSEGLIISITDASYRTDEKLLAALNVYTNDLTPEQKAAFNAKIIAICDTDNIVSATYSTNSK